jgi:hypothetical protein
MTTTPLGVTLQLTVVSNHVSMNVTPSRVEVPQGDFSITWTLTGSGAFSSSPAGIVLDGTWPFSTPSRDSSTVYSVTGTNTETDTVVSTYTANITYDSVLYSYDPEVETQPPGGGEPPPE